MKCSLIGLVTLTLGVVGTAPVTHAQITVDVPLTTLTHYWGGETAYFSYETFVNADAAFGSPLPSLPAGLGDTDTLILRFAAPTGQRLVWSGPGYNTALLFELYWGQEPAQETPLVTASSTTVAFEGLVGAAPTLTAPETRLAGDGSYLSVSNYPDLEFYPLSSFGFTALTVTIDTSNLAKSTGWNPAALAPTAGTSGVGWGLAFVIAPVFDDPTGSLTFAAVPEPAAWPLWTGLAALGLALARRPSRPHRIAV